MSLQHKLTKIAAPMRQWQRDQAALDARNQRLKDKAAIRRGYRNGAEWEAAEGTATYGPGGWTTDGHGANTSQAQSDATRQQWIARQKLPAGIDGNAMYDLNLAAMGGDAAAKQKLQQMQDDANWARSSGIKLSNGADVHGMRTAYEAAQTGGTAAQQAWNDMQGQNAKAYEQQRFRAYQNKLRQNGVYGPQTIEQYRNYKTWKAAQTPGAQTGYGAYMASQKSPQKAQQAANAYEQQRFQAYQNKLAQKGITGPKSVEDYRAYRQWKAGQPKGQRGWGAYQKSLGNPSRPAGSGMEAYTPTADTSSINGLSGSMTMPKTASYVPNAVFGSVLHSWLG